MVDYITDIPKLVDQPLAIEEKDLKNLEQLSKEHPWCSSFQIILAKGYESYDHYLQKKQLRLASTSGESCFLKYKNNCSRLPA